MLQEVVENDNFLKVSSARRLVIISGTVRAIDLKFAFAVRRCHSSPQELERSTCKELNI
jgi:hypothetical protein